MKSEREKQDFTNVISGKIIKKHTYIYIECNINQKTISRKGRFEPIKNRKSAQPTERVRKENVMKQK